jgi:hypothetical protein
VRRVSPTITNAAPAPIQIPPVAFQTTEVQLLMMPLELQPAWGLFWP